MKIVWVMAFILCYISLGSVIYKACTAEKPREVYKYQITYIGGSRFVHEYKITENGIEFVDRHGVKHTSNEYTIKENF